MVNIIHVLNQLSKNRKVFHSEADFQHAFAWELQNQYPDQVMANTAE